MCGRQAFPPTYSHPELPSQRFCVPISAANRTLGLVMLKFARGAYHRSMYDIIHLQHAHRIHVVPFHGRTMILLDERPLEDACFGMVWLPHRVIRSSRWQPGLGVSIDSSWWQRGSGPFIDCSCVVHDVLFMCCILVPMQCHAMPSVQAYFVTSYRPRRTVPVMTLLAG